jgi:hypothetical protein
MEDQKKFKIINVRESRGTNSMLSKKNDKYSMLQIFNMNQSPIRTYVVSTDSNPTLKLLIRRKKFRTFLKGCNDGPSSTASSKKFEDVFVFFVFRRLVKYYGIYCISPLKNYLVYGFPNL